MEQQRRRKLDYEIIVSNASHPGNFLGIIAGNTKSFALKTKLTITKLCSTKHSPNLPVTFGSAKFNNKQGS